MPKPRSKRYHKRNERKEKRRKLNDDDGSAKHGAKRQKLDAGEEAGSGQGETGEVFFYDVQGDRSNRPVHEHNDGGHETGGGQPEREFFGKLTDEEQEYFRRADELLELNQFPSREERRIFLRSVLREARGKELRLASSQSCSRLMEKLVLLSSTRQRKNLFEAFATHFLSLVTHRFASHCCEALFLHSAPVVSQELGGGRADDDGDEDDEEEDGAKGHPPRRQQPSMEELFLYTLDELEGHMSYLFTDRYASHTLRVLLVVLSGRPLDQFAAKSLLRSKKKERVTVSGVQTEPQELESQLRPVPDSFTRALRKIIADLTAAMDRTALKVLATHPTGNPTLQLLLELDLALNAKQKSRKDAGGGLQGDETDGGASKTLLEALLPGAPESLADPSSEASRFVAGMIFDPVGSRLVEVLTTHSPARIFKALRTNFFGPRISTYVKNDVSSYAAIRALTRMSGIDLGAAVHKILPDVPLLVARARFNVLATLFERCDVRGTRDELDLLTKALVDAVGSDKAQMIPRLCYLDEDVDDAAAQQKKTFVPDTLITSSPANMRSHGARLLSAMLAVSGVPCAAVQASLLALSADQAFRLATLGPQTSAVLVNALASRPSTDYPTFHRALVALILPHAAELAQSQWGHNVLVAVAGVSTAKGADVVISYHQKEAIMTRLVEHERELRDCWMGRNVWRAWKGDLWRTRRGDWTRWARE